jgi:hypothetical protein
MRFNKYLFLLIGVCCFVCTKAYCQDIPKELFVAAGISDSLKVDANSVIRYNMETYDVQGPGKSVYKSHSIVTVLNEKGNHEAEISLPYNKKFSTIGSFEMKIYDAEGKLIKKYHKSDLYDHAADDDETLVTDDRVLEIAHTIASYPTTVELIYERDDNSSIDLGGWYIQEPEQSVQNSSCRFFIGPDAGFRYLNKNISIKPDKSVSGNKDVYTWQVSNLKAFKMERGTPHWRVLPKIEFAQDKFDCYGYPGDISSWQNYGKWVYGLNKDVCTLSPQRVAEIKQMTDTIKTDKGKAKFLYEYMQKSMRYVAISLGIGGYKPFDANFVDQKKYGDCKALSNYMYALLKAVNIQSYWAVIRRGTNEYAANPEFPFNAFNHEILCVPFKNDTTWLECTGNSQPFGTLDITTQNRNALLITEDGGKLVNTPKSTCQQNQFNSEVHISLNVDGSAKAQAKILSTGELRSIFVDELPTLKADQQKEAILRNLDIKQPSIFDFNSGADINHIKEVDLNLEYDKFCDVIVGDKQFLKPHVLALWDATVPINEKRKTDFYFEYPMQESCITMIDLPTGFEVESMPANANLKFTYGSYDVSYAYNKDKNQVVSTAKFVLNNQVIPAAKYTEMQVYMDAVVKAQNKKLVIRKKA